MPDRDFDYIIAGAGAAGLSLLYRMIRSGKFQDKSILLADRSEKKINDRTWCFWEKGKGVFEEIVFRSWDKIGVYGDDSRCETTIAPYSYKMIRGIDFYNYCLDLIRAQSNITIKYGEITDLAGRAEDASVTIDGQTYSAHYVFSSIRQGEEKGRYNLLQHFKGWIVRTRSDAFDTKQATLMDFRTSQQHGCSFVYVMPLESNLALIEYTLFTADLLTSEQYDEALRRYLSDHHPSEVYEVLSSETGVIPMTDHAFSPRSGNLIQIGTAGGQTKPSTGYTFQFIQKRCDEIVSRLSASSSLQLPQTSRKFLFYDRVLLNVLSTNKVPGAAVFTRLFARNPATRIFRFLDNESSLPEDLKLISSLPTLPFAKAAFE